LKSKHLLALLASIILILILVATSCTPTAQPTQTTSKPATTVTVTATPTSTTAPATDKKYNVLSPRGIQLPVQISPLAARLDNFDGKHMWVTQAEADPIIMPALYKRLQKDFPKATWHFTESSARGPKQLTADEQKTAAAIIQGIGW
jgi:hypothetical protein